MGLSNPTDMSESESDRPARRKRPRLTGFAWSLDVMVIEDDAADSSLILDVLRKNPGVRQVWAYEEPENALLSLEERRVMPDLILLDIRMPKLTGFAFIEKLRAIPTFVDTQIVIVTTSCLARDVELANRAEVCEYVIKPDTYEELRARLDNTVQQALKRAWG